MPSIQVEINHPGTAEDLTSHMQTVVKSDLALLSRRRGREDDSGEPVPLGGQGHPIAFTEADIDALTAPQLLVMYSVCLQLYSDRTARSFDAIAAQQEAEATVIQPVRNRAEEITIENDL